MIIVIRIPQISTTIIITTTRTITETMAEDQDLGKNAQEDR